ncbi:MAG: alpha/beta hydrolase [Firmicutes bacterium]|nr:alpha/beta hydrolase [Bacillota bacterium]
MKILRITGKVVLAVFGLLIILIITSTINHNYKLKKESKEYPPPGKLIKVNGNKMHIYSQGQGDTTLVFMSGSGTSNPTIDFKPLWMKMINEYRIMVVEKAGYGWSEISSNPRDIDTILEETREALKIFGANRPYVLVPHSMSGLEAIYWAQKYPDEVTAIIGLDPGIPEIYENNSDILSRKNELNIMYFVSRIGLSRFMNRTELEKYLPLLKSKDLSDKDKEQLIAIFYKSSITKNMLDEIDYIQENVQKVRSNSVPSSTPMYFFISDASDINMRNWKNYLSNYVSQINFGKYKFLDSGHYVHHGKSNIIANEIKAFLKEINVN